MLDCEQRLLLAKTRAQAADASRSTVESAAVLHRQRAALLNEETAQLTVINRRLQYHLDDLNALLTERDIEINLRQQRLDQQAQQIRDLQMWVVKRWLKRIRNRLRRQWPGVFGATTGHEAAVLPGMASADHDAAALQAAPTSSDPPAPEAAQGGGPQTVVVSTNINERDTAIPPEMVTDSAALPGFAAGGMPFDATLPTILLIAAIGQADNADMCLDDTTRALQGRGNLYLWNLGAADAPSLPALRARTTAYADFSAAREDYALARGFVQQTHTLLTPQAPDCTALVVGKHCKSPLPALAGCGMPVVCLVPDAAIYRDDIYFWQELFFWATQTVFVSAQARRQALSICSYLKPDRIGLLSGAPMSGDEVRFEPARQGQDEQAQVIAGWGPASYDGGLDIFILCAQALLRQETPALPWRFVWIMDDAGTQADPGFLPTAHEEIRRAGLDSFISIEWVQTARRTWAPLPAQDSLSEQSPQSTPTVPLSAQTALLLLPARLETARSPALAALSQGIPVLSFQGSGIVAQAIEAQGFAARCLAPAGDALGLVRRLRALADDPETLLSTGLALARADWQALGWPAHAQRLLSLGQAALHADRQARADATIITASGQLDPAYMGEIVSLKDQATSSPAFLYALAWRCGMGARKPRAGFHPGIYAEQAQPAPAADEAPFAHYLAQGCPAGAWDFPVIRPEATPSGGNSAARAIADQGAGGQQRIALHIHAYYPDMLTDIIHRLHLNQTRPDLYISVPGPTQLAAASALLADYQGRVSAIEIVPNRGRDIGPFLSTFGTRLAQHYDLIGHVHTKRSPHAERRVIDQWRVFLMENLLGGERGGAMLDTIAALMAAHPEWGLAFADDPLLLGWDGNRQCAQLLARYMGVDTLPERFVFPAGTMFWIKPQALQPFLDLKLGYDDYPDEPLPIDGSVLHALERLFGVVPQAKGLQNALISVPGLSR